MFGKTEIWNWLLVAGVVGLATAGISDDLRAATADDLKCKGCVGTSDIGTGAVTTGKLAAKAQPAYAAFSGQSGVSISPLPDADTVVASVTLKLPGPGFVIVNSSGYAAFETDPGGIACTITKSKTVDNPKVIANAYADHTGNQASIGGTRGFYETKGGKKTYRLVCKPQWGANSASINDALLTAIYAPTGTMPLLGDE